MLVNTMRHLQNIDHTIPGGYAPMMGMIDPNNNQVPHILLIDQPDTFTRINHASF